MRDDFRTMTYILHEVPHFGGIGWHWTFWVCDKLGGPWDKAAYLFVGTVKRTMIYIILGKLQYLLLRQQGYRDKWWMLMTLIAPLVARIPDLIIFTLVMPFIGWLTLFIDIPISLDVIREMTRIASGLGFGATQWLLLRRRFHRAAWWMVATALGAVLCRFRYSDFSKVMYGVIEGAIKGAITGVAMIWLLWRSTERVALVQRRPC
jgi:hypothetical protein